MNRHRLRLKVRSTIHPHDRAQVLGGFWHVNRPPGSYRDDIRLIAELVLAFRLPKLNFQLDASRHFFSKKKG
jgi:hypothetical protein